MALEPRVPTTIRSAPELRAMSATACAGRVPTSPLTSSDALMPSPESSEANS